MRPSGSRGWPSGPGVSRRQFVAALSGPLIAAAACSRRLYDPHAFRRLQQSPVVLLPAASYSVDFADSSAAALQELRVDVRGRRVLLKPNMVEYQAGRAINTSRPRCRRRGPRDEAGRRAPMSSLGKVRATVGTPST